MDSPNLQYSVLLRRRLLIALAIALFPLEVYFIITSVNRFISWAVVGIALIGTVFAVFLILKRSTVRWSGFCQQALAKGYLQCPGCGHDLRGGSLAGSARPLPLPADATEEDVVICPECGESYRVKNLPSLWNGRVDA